MNIFLVRHAIAEPKGPDEADEERALTPEGIEKFNNEVTGLRELGVKLDRIFHSPWRRARQTAELLHPLLVSEDIEASCRATEVLAKSPGPALLRCFDADRVAMVGHQPWMGELCAMLVADDQAIGDHFPFKKGGVAWLEGMPVFGGCALRGFWTPKSLCAISRAKVS